MKNKSPQLEQSLIHFYLIHYAKVLRKAFKFILRMVFHLLRFVISAAFGIFVIVIALNGLQKTYDDSHKFLSENPDYVCEHIPSICDSAK